jgi:hypothetical protein
MKRNAPSYNISTSSPGEAVVVAVFR